SDDCVGCSGDAALAYALGQIGFDFGTEARRDSFTQAMGGNPDDPERLLNWLNDNPYYAASVTWTLVLDGTPIYAIQPGGAFPQVAYDRIREFLKDQLAGTVERVSIPGIWMGGVQLMSGQNVPVLIPDPRGMFSWSTVELVKAVCGEPPKKDNDEYNSRLMALSNFLERIYFELRNLGQAAPERAMNFAATNTLQSHDIFAQAAKDGQELDQISVEPSPVCRPDSDCWDVKLIFFKPTDRQGTARKVHRFTIDVSDVVPVTVGPPRSWSVY
ncbi:MAG: peptidase S8, partial [Acidobacteriota bacterium]|nr:peptidase S8 [Acidobacteriota bacterium]